jgi:hypothetical protein
MQKTFIEILHSSIDERRTLFETVAAHLGTQAANIEKDLYVCWVLDFLFNRRPNDPVGLYFKGGTSLSKAYGLVRRFSEDIDIGIYTKPICTSRSKPTSPPCPPSIGSNARSPRKSTRPRGNISPDRSENC